MYVPEINAVKTHLEALKKVGFIKEWELPYENILTRRSAAIFFVSPEETHAEGIWQELEKYNNFSYRLNSEKKLSKLEYRVTFSAEEKEKNEKQRESAVAGS